MSEEILTEHKEIWNKKPTIRTIYHDYYKRILAQTVPGNILEIGGGSGNFKEFAPSIISTDIVPLPWINCACDAQQLPFQNSSVNNIVGIDILHHLQNPVIFIAEALRILKAGGRIVLLEPAVTPFSFMIYKLFHPEPVNFNCDPFLIQEPDLNKKPFDANQAIPEIMFKRKSASFKEKFPNLTILQAQYVSLFAYPLSGGFRPWSLITNNMAKSLIAYEMKVEKFLGKIFAFKLLTVLQKMD